MRCLLTVVACFFGPSAFAESVLDLDGTRTFRFNFEFRTPMKSECKLVGDDEVMHGYKVLRCLGSGFDGQAFLVEKNGAKSVMKIGNVPQTECSFAN